MKRLLIISRCSEPRGGADRIIVDLCRELPNMGWDVVLGLTQGANFNSVERYCEFHGDITALAIDGTLGTRRSRLKALERCIRTTEPDVVLSVRVADVYEVMAGLKQKMQDPPRLAVGVRAFEAPYFFDLKRYIGFVDLCVTSGQLIAKACSDLAGIDPSRAISIPGGVRPPHVPSDRVSVSRPVRILYAGRLEQSQKRCLDLIAVASELQSRGVKFQLVIAGAGPAESEMRQAAIKEGLESRVEFLGWVAEEDLYASVYPQADLFLHTAAWEGVTIAPREAMAHGVVPVMSEFIGCKAEGQFVHDRTALTFPVGDVNRAADHIQTLIQHPETYQRLSGGAQQSQQDGYSFRGTMKSWDTALKECLRNSSLLSASIPVVVDKTSGVLANLPVPNFIADGIRRLLRRPVQHKSPGSEWPTTTGLTTNLEVEQLQAWHATADHSNENVTSGALPLAR